MTTRKKKKETKKSDGADRLSIPEPFPGDPPQPWPFPPLPGNPWFPWIPQPRPLPIIETADRDVGEAQLGMVVQNGDELLKRIYARPDYQYVIDLYSKRLEEAFAENPDALRQLMEIIATDADDTDDRIAPAVVYGAAFLGGAVLGYFAEK